MPPKAPALGVELGVERDRKPVEPSHYQTRRANDGRIIVPRDATEIELFATDQLEAATGIDVVISPAGGGTQALLTDAIVRVYAETGGVMVLCEESVRSIVDLTRAQRVTHVRNRVARRFRATIQGRPLAAVGGPPARLLASYALIGREPHADEPPYQPSRFVPAVPVSGNTGTLVAGAGAIVQAHFVNAGAALTWVMLFNPATYPPPAPVAADPFFDVLPCPAGGNCSFDFVRGLGYLNGVTFACSTNPAAYVVDGAGNVTGKAEVR